MKNKLICSLAIVALVAGCGSDENKAAKQAQFETVQEGSAPGVTSTIHGPGETIPPMTATNVDTTSAFTLNTNAVPPTQPAGGTIAGTFPDPTGMTTPMQTSPSGTYRPPVTRSTPSRSTPAPRRSDPDPQYPPPTDTTTESTAPTTTATTSTQPPAQTTTGPPAQQRPKKNAEEEDEDEDESEQTDTAPPPPPPA